MKRLAVGLDQTGREAFLRLISVFSNQEKHKLNILYCTIDAVRCTVVFFGTLQFIV